MSNRSRHRHTCTRSAAVAALCALLVAGCSGDVESPTPSLTDVAPGLVCNDQLTTPVRIIGAGLSPVVVDSLTEAPGLFLPDIRLRRTGELDGSPAAQFDEVDIDESQEEGRVRWLSQQAMELDVDPDLSLVPGVYDVLVTNLDGQTAHLPAGLTVVPPPRLDEVVPTPICTAQFANEVTLNGEGFLIVGGIFPTVDVGGLAVTPDEVTDCFTLGGPAAAQSCSSMIITIEQGALPPGDYPVEVSNPEPANCASTEEVILSVVPPPTLTSVEPSTICSTGSLFTAYGEGFRDGATVFVGEAVSLDVAVDDTGTSAEVQMGGDLAPGIHDVTFQNAEGCEDTLEAAITVVPGPILFFVDPPVVYQGIATQASLLVGGLTGEVLRVAMQEVATGEVTDLCVAPDCQVDRNIVQVVIPAGMSEGDYHVFLEEDTSCVPILENAVFVEADLTVAIDSVHPSFGWTDSDTAIDVRAADPAPAGSVQFESIPRVYLNPDSPGEDTVATTLASVSFSSPTRLTAVAPDGLDADIYDLIVVNPSGSIGLLEGGFTITRDPPPVVDSVSPVRVDASDDTPVTLRGRDFRSPTVDLTCQTASGGSEGASVAVTGDTDTLTGTVPSSGLTEGSVCVVRVTNGDGSFFDFSAVSVGSPSGNLFGFSDGPDMIEARRSPAAVAGRATTQARYLYAIGGDSGTVGGTLNSVEAAPLDAFGDLGEWNALPGPLPEGRTMAGVWRIGRFIFLVGGHDGSGPLSTVLRAQVLDPRAAPELADLGFDFGEGDGLGGGTWVYRISAVFPESYAINPSGESLASDPIVVRLPDIEDKIHLTLAWTRVPGADGYRVYRSPAADAGSGAERLVAEVAGGDSVTFTDTGDEAMGGPPLPDGALGTWATVATLPEPRQGPCVAAGRDPDDPEVWYLYVAGGQSAGSTVVDTIDFYEVTDEGATVGNRRRSAHTLAPARWQCGGFVVDETFHDISCDSSEPPVCETWIYFGPGRLDGGSTTGNVDTGRVGPGGELSGFGAVSRTNPGRAGYGSASASNFLYVFGGQQGGPSDGGREGELGKTDPFPDLDWDSIGGGGISSSRFLCGAAQESAVIFVVGGTTGNASASDSTELANY